jgi:hypothetical protein
VSLLIPLSILLYLQAKRVARQMDEVKSDLKEMIKDSRTMIQNINHLSTHANQQLDELDKMVGIVRKWSERTSFVLEFPGQPPQITPATRKKPESGRSFCFFDGGFWQANLGKSWRKQFVNADSVCFCQFFQRGQPQINAMTAFNKLIILVGHIPRLFCGHFEVTESFVG